jgi:SpoVK/Ycf46/Vps4 family AAA+-type ATPase
METNNQTVKKAAVAQKAESAEAVSQPTKEMDILDHIDEIVTISKKTGIDKCLSQGKAHLDFVCEKLTISPLQAVLFSHFMERSDDNRILISEIAKSLKCSKVKIIKYLNDCDELVKKKLIRCSRNDNNLTFRIPRDVRDSLRKFNEYTPACRENLSIFTFFSLLNELFDERADDELTFETLSEEILDLIKLNMHLEFCKKVMSYNLCPETLTLLVCFCHLAGNNNDDNIGTHDLSFIYDSRIESSHVFERLTGGRHTLITGKYVEFTNSHGFINSESWKVSDMAKKELLSELGATKSRSYEKNLMRHDSIKPKKMFYNDRENKEIKTLMSLLAEENYRMIQERLEAKGMRKGFACLFSGGPGTGKTETVYQIARETKRHVMLVDISQTKSMWFGESEKKIKEIFDSYRNAVENSDIAPILLFNEADAIIGKRKEFTASSRAVDQTENTIQNIILQEMENLSGILIATTNLTQNMDNAFERRFLYKINFDKPGLESRKGIWKSLIEDLSEDTAAELSSRFELSGGQIENIARKVNVDTILYGGELALDTLVTHCNDESKNNFTFAKRIGFSV